jgi:mannose-6-phosphate isomerase-like protein (cupin superfamily)
VTSTQLVSAVSDSRLALDEVRLAENEVSALGDREVDTLLFCSEGSGVLELGGRRFSLAARQAALVLAGETARLTAGAEGLVAVLARVGPGADLHAQLGEREVVVALDGAGADAATGSRSFQVLFGPHNGSTRATLFMGFVPPGKAPWHFHLYDEIVWIPNGPAQLHRKDEASERLGAGAAFRLQPREVHIVENPSANVLEVLGVFSPAGSPSAAYLPAG